MNEGNQERLPFTVIEFLKRVLSKDDIRGNSVSIDFLTIHERENQQCSRMFACNNTHCTVQSIRHTKALSKFVKLMHERISEN